MSFRDELTGVVKWNNTNNTLLIVFSITQIVVLSSVIVSLRMNLLCDVHISLNFDLNLPKWFLRNNFTKVNSQIVHKISVFRYPFSTANGMMYCCETYPLRVNWLKVIFRSTILMRRPCDIIWKTLTGITAQYLSNVLTLNLLPKYRILGMFPISMANRMLYCNERYPLHTKCVKTLHIY